jgi:hypothetical protein
MSKLEQIWRPLTDTAPNNGMQATSYSLRLAVLGSGFPPRLMPGVRRLSLSPQVLIEKPEKGGAS